jgi:hypothetical protein
LANLTFGSSRAAARSKCGAITWQGPHHGAQKSTSSGSSLRSAWALKWSTPSTSGCAVNSGWWQRPQDGPSASRAAGTRLSEWQCGQARVVVSVMRWPLGERAA